jgi:hypothetical protein
MMLKSMPKETVVQLLLYLAEHESFESIDKGFKGSISPQDVSGILYELAEFVQRTLHTDDPGLSDEDKQHFSTSVRSVLAALSPSEEQALLRNFGLIED